MTDPTASALLSLEAERLRTTRDEKPADPLRELIGALDRLLTAPGPTDAERFGSSALLPGLPDSPNKITEEGS